MVTFLLCWLAIALVAALILGPFCAFNNPPKSVRDEVNHELDLG
jgi:hypothetical protein